MNDPLLGTQLDNFLIQEALGHGGMARVYKGLDLNLNRPVAIKVIEENFRSSSSYNQRFEREAQAVANLKHPNIVTVFMFGKTNGLYYLVMEYIDGVNLDTILRNYERNLELPPYADVAFVMRSLASALDYAHARGVIHRDIKPSNVMLEQDGRLVLTDFGLALRVSEGTQGASFGSPHYISPEQARSSANAVPQSDQYSLGVIAYEMLVGRVPFDDTSATALAMQHIMQAPPSPHSINRTLNLAVEQVLLKVLAKRPDERYDSASDFSTALVEALNSMRTYSTNTVSIGAIPVGSGIHTRRISPQSVLNKVHQEISLARARGAPSARHLILGELHASQAERSTWDSQAGASNVSSQPQRENLSETLPPDQSSKRRRWLSALLGGMAILIIGLLGFFLLRPSGIDNQPNQTQTALAVMASLVSNSPEPTKQFVVPTSPPSTATSLPTLTPTPPPTVTLTPSPIDGETFVLRWTPTTFFIAHQGTTRIRSSSLAFAQIGGQFRLNGQRWSTYYGYLESKYCLVAHLSGEGWKLPADICPAGYNAEVVINSQELFWVADNGSTEFSVLANDREIGRCQISAGTCTVMISPSAQQ